MTFVNRFRLGLCVGALFAGILALPQRLPAQEHVVSSADLEKDVAAAAQARQQHIATIEKFLSSTQAQHVLESANVDYRVVKTGISTLSDDELARLSARADLAQKDFAAGALTNEELTYIIIALATAVIILIAVH